MKSMKLVWLIAFTLVSFFSAQATVRPVPGQYARIQHAVDFANDGDTILIAPNTYTGPGNRDVLILNKGLTIMGAGDASSVIIHVDDTNWYRAFAVIDPLSAVRFENLTIEKASGWESELPYSGGSGIRFRNATVAINNCRFIDCFGISGGGAMYFEGSTVGISNCVFDSCVGDRGGTLYCDSATTCTIWNSSFTNGGSIEDGGAILAEGATLEIRSCEFINNCALDGPFGVGGYGGAIDVRFGGSLKVDNCSFLHNWTYAYGGAILISNNSDLEIDSSLFEGNFVKCTIDFQGNLLGSGGAIYFIGGSCAISSCSFVGNFSRCWGPVVYISALSATVHQSIIAESDTGSAFGGYADFTCSDIFGNAGGDWTGSIASQLGQNGNISEDPLFCGAFPGDYRLSASSPCAAANDSCAVTMGSEAVGCDILCGDPNLSGAVTISDAVFLIEYIFANGEPPAVMQTGDVDCSGTVNISDVVYLLNYIFSGGLNPCNACP